jgi:hypothetical protein
MGNPSNDHNSNNQDHVDNYPQPNIPRQFVQAHTLAINFPPVLLQRFIYLWCWCLALYSLSKHWYIFIRF